MRERARQVRCRSPSASECLWDTSIRIPTGISTRVRASGASVENLNKNLHSDEQRVCESVRAYGAWRRTSRARSKRAQASNAPGCVGTSMRIST
eukprot:1521558-Rhodomonas_salina.1